jgi:hypothetical protein
MARREASAYELGGATESDREFLWGLHEAAMRGPVERTWG